MTDTDGAAIAGATVTITEKITGRTITVTTNGFGSFKALALLPGHYTVKIQYVGFRGAVLENVTVLIGQVASANVSIQVGLAQETVHVSSDTDSIGELAAIL